MSVDGDCGRSTGLDSTSIFDFPSINNLTSQNDGSHSEMIPQRLSSGENMDDTVLDVEIKEEIEVSDIFIRRSIDDENDETIFLTELHDQPAPTSIASNSRTETHLLPCTQVYNDEKGTPSSLQTPTRNSSIISTNHFSPPKVSNEIQTKPATSITLTEHFLCVLCGMKFPTFVERNDHVLGVHEHSLCRHTKQKYCKYYLCRVNISIPTNHVIKVHQRKVLSAHTEERRYGESNLKALEGETPEERKRRKSKESSRRGRERQRQSETPEQRKAKLAAQAERRLANETPEQRTKRLAVQADRQRKYWSKMTPEQRKAKLAIYAERRRERRANETPEQKKARRPVDAKRQRKSKLVQRSGTHTGAGASDLVQWCEYGEITFAWECDRKSHVGSCQGNTIHP